jgi:hypothetical protein
VQLKFKTTAQEGLLFLAGKGHTFLSVELRDGNVVYQVWQLSLHPKIFKHCHALHTTILITVSGYAVFPVILSSLHGKYMYFNLYSLNKPKNSHVESEGKNSAN